MDERIGDLPLAEDFSMVAGLKGVSGDGLGHSRANAAILCYRSTRNCLEPGLPLILPILLTKDICQYLFFVSYSVRLHRYQNSRYYEWTPD